MYRDKDSTNKAIFYTRAVNSPKDTWSIDTQIKRAQSYAKSTGLNLQEIFVDETQVPIYYIIKDRASVSSQKSFQPKRLLMPDLVPVYQEAMTQLIEMTAFQRMLAYIRSNPVNVLLISKLEILFANMKDAFSFVDNELNPRRIALKTLGEIN
ncbi:MAG: hypothetical protein ACMUIL_00660 [bacterium]